MKLTRTTVRAIRIDSANGLTDSQLSAKYNIYQGGAIWSIVHGETYRRAGGPIVPPPKYGDSRAVILQWFEAAFRKPIDPAKLLSDADAAQIFCIISLPLPDLESSAGGAA